ncbi:single-stranded DNA-binding protein [Sphingobacterium siyangense]|uniref:single-stranded DNA-binding protein n=1 Tax=Sphingobacterium siyangense TaxID=459529 RepID=UPI003DA2F74A
MNKLILVGRIGKDPETRTFDNGSVTTFSLATTETFKDRSGERREKTEWHNISFWGKLGESVAKFFKKGDPILVEGKITYREYEKDGKKSYVTDIQCSSFEFLPKNSGTNSNSSSPGNADMPAPVDLGNTDDDDGLPF